MAMSARSRICAGGHGDVSQASPGDDQHAILRRGIGLQAGRVVPNIPHVPLGRDGVARKEL